MMAEKSAIPRCQAGVLHRDGYRYSGRGKSGYTLRHITKQCTRKSTNGNEYCTQHTNASHVYSLNHTPRRYMDYGFLKETPCN